MARTKENASTWLTKGEANSAAWTSGTPFAPQAQTEMTVASWPLPSEVSTPME